MSEIVRRTTKYLVTQQQLELFDDLVKQIKKDIQMSGIDTDEFSTVDSAEDLINHLKFFIETLITNYADLFSNLMYRIDIPEKHMNQLDFSNMENLIEQLVYFIIKREGQKVYFKKRFS